MIPGVGVLRRREPSELAHGPQFAAIHRFVDAARVREIAGLARIDGVGVNRFERQPAERPIRFGGGESHGNSILRPPL